MTAEKPPRRVLDVRPVVKNFQYKESESKDNVELGRDITRIRELLKKALGENYTAFLENGSVISENSGFSKQEQVELLYGQLKLWARKLALKNMGLIGHSLKDSGVTPLLTEPAYKDLVSELFLALWKVAMNYDPDLDKEKRQGKPRKFSTYAVASLKKKMLSGVDIYGIDLSPMDKQYVFLITRCRQVLAKYGYSDTSDTLVIKAITHLANFTKKERYYLTAGDVETLTPQVIERLLNDQVITSTDLYITTEKHLLPLLLAVNRIELDLEQRTTLTREEDGELTPSVVSKTEVMTADGDSDRPIEDELIGKEFKEQLGNMLGELKERERKVMEMLYGLDKEGVYTIAEVARELGISENAVRNTEQRVLRRFRNPNRARMLRDAMPDESFYYS